MKVGGSAAGRCVSTARPEWQPRSGSTGKMTFARSPPTTTIVARTSGWSARCETGGAPGSRRGLARSRPRGRRARAGQPSRLAPARRPPARLHRPRAPGRARAYIVHVPPAARDGQPLPVVLSFHGGGGNAENQQKYSRMDPVADVEGFLAVYPDGTGRMSDRLLTWNAGTCCAYSVVTRVDDVGFTLAVLSELEARQPIERRRVYAPGLSNAALVAWRPAVEASVRVAAIAPRAGGRVLQVGQPARPVSVMHFHSVDDPRALYNGGPGPPFPVPPAQGAPP